MDFPPQSNGAYPLGKPNLTDWVSDRTTSLGSMAKIPLYQVT
ncbi:MAG: hypothetical protein WBG32_19005 [Nodosilinea sp.]